jgi:hypothetical protein
VDKFVPAEKANYDAVQAVEGMPADPRLTDAVVLLQKARDSVADYVDGVERRANSDGWDEVEAIRQAIAPVIDWYQSDEHHPRLTVDIIKDIVADLQKDRAEVLKLRRVRAQDLYDALWEVSEVPEALESLGRSGLPQLRAARNAIADACEAGMRMSDAAQHRMFMRGCRIAKNHIGQHRGQHVWAWYTGNVWNWTYGEFDGVGSATTKEKAMEMAKETIDRNFEDDNETLAELPESLKPEKS